MTGGEKTADSPPECDFFDCREKKAEGEGQDIPVQDIVIQHKETDNKQAKPDRDGVCHACNLVQVRAGCNYCKRPIVPATSAIRAEKPHSLSYHASTRTVRPPTTLVWSGAKMQDSVVWLKSMLTLASSS